MGRASRKGQAIRVEGAGGRRQPRESLQPPWKPGDGWKRVPAHPDDRGSVATFRGSQGSLSYVKNSGWEYDGRIGLDDARRIAENPDWQESDDPLYEDGGLYIGPSQEGRQPRLILDEGKAYYNGPLSDDEARRISGGGSISSEKNEPEAVGLKQEDLGYLIEGLQEEEGTRHLAETLQNEGIEALSRSELLEVVGISRDLMIEPYPGEQRISTEEQEAHTKLEAFARLTS